MGRLHRPSSVAALAVVALLAGPVAAATPEFEWSERIAAGRTLEVRGVNGDVRVVATEGSEAVVRATKRAKRSRPESVTIELVRHDDGITVCAVYPSADEDAPNRCAPGGRGRMNVRDNDVTVDFEIELPAGVRLAGGTVNGDVDVDGARAAVDVHTVNGSIAIETTGPAAATTVNGSIQVAMGRFDAPIELTTVNGEIEVGLAADQGAELDATTTNGRVSSDLPVTVRGRLDRRRLVGAIGDGGPRLTLRTVNGGIHLRRSRS